MYIRTSMLVAIKMKINEKYSSATALNNKKSNADDKKVKFIILILEPVTYERNWKSFIHQMPQVPTVKK